MKPPEISRLQDERPADSIDAFERDAQFAVSAAAWAPSVHDTQPWRFGVQGSHVTLRADPECRLTVADPDGREMLISCGAALFALSVALRRLGYAPDVRLLPDADRPHLLADVRFARRRAENEDTGRLYVQVRERRTHRGTLRPDVVPATLQSMLSQETRREGVTLRLAVDGQTKFALAALTEAAEHVQRLNPAYAAEAARWAPGSRPQDDVHEGAEAEPHFPAHDFARTHGWGIARVIEADTGDVPWEPMTGAVALLTTKEDTPLDWLRSGQALQRLLLRAGAEEGLSAAFHTQALELPELRAFIRTRFCGGDHPQLLLRLGVTGGGFTTVRRPIGELLYEEP